MKASAIRCLAASKKSARIAAALFERRIQIWDLESRTVVSDFDTVFSFGGNRLGLDSSGKRCVAAAWEGGQGGGVACYETTTGKQIWHRPDLRQSQRLRFSATDKAIWCVPDRGPTKCLDSGDGKTLYTMTELTDIFESEYSPDLFLERRKGDYILKNSENVKIPRLKFAILDAAFGPWSFAISEAGGPVRCMDSSTGQELWRHSPGSHLHFLRLWYCDTDESFYGVQCGLRYGSFRSFVRLNGASGESQTLCHLDSWEETYCARLGCLLTSDGEMTRLSDGRVFHRLQFPQKDNRDKSDALPEP
jgi:WD40 repeat protein